MGKTEGKTYLGRAALLAAQDIPIEEIEVPEWGTWVRIRALTGAERDTFEGEITRRNGKSIEVNVRNIRARLVAMSMVDETGARIFGVQDIEALGEKSAKALDRIFSVAQRLSGLRDEDVQELAENFDTTPGGDSTFASR